MVWSEHVGDALGHHKEDRGTIKFQPGERPPPTVVGTLLRILVAVPLLYFYFTEVKEIFDLRTFKDWSYAFYGLGVYLFFAFFIRPKPGSYMGNVYYWVNGEHYYGDPYTTTDDINNLLLWMMAFLLPGVIICEAIIDPFRLLLRLAFPAWYERERKIMGKK